MFSLLIGYFVTCIDVFYYLFFNISLISITDIQVVIDAFRTINPQSIALNQEPRQTTSNLGHLQKPSIQALIHGLNRHYYSIPINYRTHELEQKVIYLSFNKFIVPVIIVILTSNVYEVNNYGIQFSFF